MNGLSFDPAAWGFIGQRNCRAEREREREVARNRGPTFFFSNQAAGSIARSSFVSAWNGPLGTRATYPRWRRREGGDTRQFRRSPSGPGSKGKRDRWRADASKQRVIYSGHMPCPDLPQNPGNLQQEFNRHPNAPPLRGFLFLPSFPLPPSSEILRFQIFSDARIDL